MNEFRVCVWMSLHTVYEWVYNLCLDEFRFSIWMCFDAFEKVPGWMSYNLCLNEFVRVYELIKMCVFGWVNNHERVHSKVGNGSVECVGRV